MEKCEIYLGRLVNLKYDQLPYVKKEEVVRPVIHSDMEGVPMRKDGNKFYYHPVMIAEYGLHLLNCIEAEYGKNEIRYQLSKIYRALISIGAENNWYYAYYEDFKLHGMDDELMPSGWVSGMAQGMILSFLCRIVHLRPHDIFSTPLDEDKTILHAMGEILKTLDEGKCTCKITINGIDYKWIEEYPQEKPCYTLNGMIYATFGVYDYWNIFGNKKNEDLLRTYLYTIRSTVRHFRVPGEVSYYCLKHKVQSIQYHNYHIQQLWMLYKMTGDEFFKTTAIDFTNDTRDYGKS